MKVGNTGSSTSAWITTALGSTPPNVWAPDINYFDGAYHLYYGASRWGTSSAVMGLLTATNPAGPWTDQGMVTNVNYPINPDVVRGSDGRLYVSWGSWAGGGVYMYVLNETTGKLSTTDNNLWKIATGVEGVSIVHGGGYFYLLLASKGLCCSVIGSDYYTVVARASSVTGPYLDKARQNIATAGGTLVLRGANPCIAGGDVFTDGATTSFAHHYYYAANAGRETLDIRTLTYSNGWPVLAVPLGKADLVLQAQHSSLCLDVWQASTAEGAAVNQGNCNGGSNQRWTAQANGSGFRVVNSTSEKCLQPLNGGWRCHVTGDLHREHGAALDDHPDNRRLCLVDQRGVRPVPRGVRSLPTNGASTNQWSCSGGRTSPGFGAKRLTGGGAGRLAPPFWRARPRGPGRRLCVGELAKVCAALQPLNA